MTSKPGITPYIKRLPKLHRVLFGTVSGIIATALVHPFDVIIVRLQISDQSFSTKEMARRIWRCQGPRALYSGLTAGIMRQATYTSTRLTVYHLLNERSKRNQNIPNTSSLRTNEKVVIGAYAGLVGAFVGTPSEVALVRMMADGPSDPCSRGRRMTRYRGVLHAFFKIAREDGITALWRGGTLTLTRSLLVSVAQIGTYAKVNEVMTERNVKEGMSLHLFTSFVSSFVTTIITLPVDIVKSRFYLKGFTPDSQNVMILKLLGDAALEEGWIPHEEAADDLAKVAARHWMRYQVHQYTMTKSDILHDIVDKKGVFYLWKGITPYLIRMSIHTTATLVIFENFTELYYKHVED